MGLPKGTTTGGTGGISASSSSSSLFGGEIDSQFQPEQFEISAIKDAIFHAWTVIEPRLQAEYKTKGNPKKTEEVQMKKRTARSDSASSVRSNSDFLRAAVSYASFHSTELRYGGTLQAVQDISVSHAMDATARTNALFDLEKKRSMFRHCLLKATLSELMSDFTNLNPITFQQEGFSSRLTPSSTATSLGGTTGVVKRFPVEAESIIFSALLSELIGTLGFTGDLLGIASVGTTTTNSKGEEEEGDEIPSRSGDSGSTRTTEKKKSNSSGFCALPQDRTFIMEDGEGQTPSAGSDSSSSSSATGSLPLVSGRRQKHLSYKNFGLALHQLGSLTDLLVKLNEENHVELQAMTKTRVSLPTARECLCLYRQVYLLKGIRFLQVVVGKLGLIRAPAKMSAAPTMSPAFKHLNSTLLASKQLDFTLLVAVCKITRLDQSNLMAVLAPGSIVQSIIHCFALMSPHFSENDFWRCFPVTTMKELATSQWLPDDAQQRGLRSTITLSFQTALKVSGESVIKLESALAAEQLKRNTSTATATATTSTSTTSSSTTTTGGKQQEATAANLLSYNFTKSNKARDEALTALGVIALPVTCAANSSNPLLPPPTNQHQEEGDAVPPPPGAPSSSTSSGGTTAAPSIQSCASYQQLMTIASQKPFIGLENMGNTCYANSVLQALHRCMSFRNEIVDSVFQNLKKGGSLIAQGITTGKGPGTFLVGMAMSLAEMGCHHSPPHNRSVPRQLMSCEFAAIRPEWFIRNLPEPFFGGGQHDASEFCKSLFVNATMAADVAPASLNRKKKQKGEKVEDEEKRTEEEERQDVEKAAANVIQKFFEAKSATTYKCSQCGNCSTRVETQWDLMLNFPTMSTTTNTPAVVTASASNSQTGGGGSSSSPPGTQPKKISEKEAMIESKKNPISNQVLNVDIDDSEFDPDRMLNNRSSSTAVDVAAKKSSTVGQGVHSSTTSTSEAQASAGTAIASSSPSPLLKVQDLIYDAVGANSKEHLTGDDRYQCDKCEAKVDATRYFRHLHGATEQKEKNEQTREEGEENRRDAEEEKTNGVEQEEMISSPPYLILQLNRFLYNKKTFAREKIMTKTDLPLRVLIPSLGTKTPSAEGGELEDDSKLAKVPYQLVATVVHSGPSLSAGHYYAYVSETVEGAVSSVSRQQSEKDGAAAAAVVSETIPMPLRQNWYCCNDSTVSNFCTTVTPSSTTPSSTTSREGEECLDIRKGGNTDSSVTPYLLFYQREDTLVTAMANTAECLELTTAPPKIEEEVEGDESPKQEYDGRQAEVVEDLPSSSVMSTITNQVGRKDDNTLPPPPLRIPDNTQLWPLSSLLERIIWARVQQREENILSGYGGSNNSYSSTYGGGNGDDDNDDGGNGGGSKKYLNNKYYGAGGGEYDNYYGGGDDEDAAGGAGAGAAGGWGGGRMVY